MGDSYSSGSFWAWVYFGAVAAFAVVGFVVGGPLGGTLAGVALGGPLTAAIFAGIAALLFGTLVAVFVALGWVSDTTTTTTTTDTTTTTTTSDDGSTTTTETTTTTTTTEEEGGACFASGTLVSTPSGPKAIEKLRPRDLVHAHNLDSQQREAKAIRSTRSAWRSEIVVLRLGKEEIRCTPVHRFCTGKEWLPAKWLRVGDQLLRLDGQKTTVTGIRRLRRRTRVHNLIVDGLRNYAISHQEVVGSSDKGDDGEGEGSDGQPD